jgi:hypothetical protein
VRRENADAFPVHWKDRKTTGSMAAAGCARGYSQSDVNPQKLEIKTS